MGRGERCADPAKIDGITKLLPPRDANEVRTFLGAAGWYRDLVPSFGLIAKPLTTLLKKNESFRWGAEQEAAWKALKAALTSDPVLKLPTDDGEYLLYTDWSAEGISAVLH